MTSPEHLNFHLHQAEPGFADHASWATYRMSQPGAVERREYEAAMYNAAAETAESSHETWQERAYNYSDNAATLIASHEQPPFETNFKVVDVEKHKPAKWYDRKPTAPNTDPRNQPDSHVAYEGWIISNRQVRMSNGGMVNEVTFVDTSGELMVYVDNVSVTRLANMSRPSKDPMVPDKFGKRVVRTPYAKDYAKTIGAVHHIEPGTKGQTSINGVHTYRNLPRSLKSDAAAENNRLLALQQRLAEFGFDPRKVSNLPRS